jgi:hypothetical protein
MSVFSKLFPRSGLLSLKRGLNPRLIIIFTVLTMVLTAIVIVGWEKLLRPPYFAWVERNYPGAENATFRNKLEQRVEHVFISMTVDLIVVSLLLAIVSRKQERLIAVNEQLAHS